MKYKKCVQYSILSCKLIQAIGQKADQRTLAAFDRATWLVLANKSLAKNLGVEEASFISEFAKKHVMPEGFWLPLAEALEDQLGVKFKKPKYNVTVFRMDMDGNLEELGVDGKWRNPSGN